MTTTPTTTLATAILFGLLALPAAGNPTPSRTPAEARQAALEREAADLIGQVESIGRDVRLHAETVLALAANPLVLRSTHYHYLMLMQDLVNSRLGPAMARLARIEPDLPEWKRDSIARMVTASTQLAQDATSAFFAKQQDPLLLPIFKAEYRDFMRNVSAHADDLARTADAAHSYATAQLKAREVGLMVSR